MTTFKDGDVVQLKSGGRKMTVHSPPDGTLKHVHCQWFAGSKLESGSFPPDSLTAVAPDGAGQTKK